VGVVSAVVLVVSDAPAYAWSRVNATNLSV
jgi:hypothetical protein